MKRDESGALRYCLAVLATVLAVVGVVVGINAVVDPFAMFRWIERDGFNAYKPATYRRVRLFKAYELMRLRPQTIVLGSSRTHLGIRCTHPALAALPGPCYNLAFDGATTREMLAYLRHAHAIRPLRQVILGLDAYHASTAPSATRPDFDPLILLDPATPRAWRRITGDLRLLASIDSLRASVDTVRAQSATEPQWFAADGQRLGEVFFRRSSENFVREGPRAYFDEIDRLEVGFQKPEPAGRPAPAGDPSPSSLAYIAQIVAFCRDQGIDLRIFITPSHVHQLEITSATWGYAGIENGKRALVRLLDDDARAHPQAQPVQLLDFSGYSSLTTEPLPPRGSHEEMRFYWDSSHFKSLVGDHVLDRLFPGSGASSTAPGDFGVRLDSASIEPYLQDQRAAQAAYRRRFATEIAALRALAGVNTAVVPDDAPVAMQ